MTYADIGDDQDADREENQAVDVTQIDQAAREAKAVAAQAEKDFAIAFFHSTPKTAIMRACYELLNKGAKPEDLFVTVAEVVLPRVNSGTKQWIIKQAQAVRPTSFGTLPHGEVEAAYMGRQREIRHALARAAHDAGALIEFQRTGAGHQRVHLTYGGHSRFFTISGTPGNFGALGDMLADERRTLRKLGYVKPSKPKKPDRPRPQAGISSTVAAPAPLPPMPRRRTDPDIYLNGMGAALDQLRRKKAS